MVRLWLEVVACAFHRPRRLGPSGVAPSGVAAGATELAGWRVLPRPGRPWATVIAGRRRRPTSSG